MTDAKDKIRTAVTGAKKVSRPPREISGPRLKSAFLTDYGLPKDCPVEPLGINGDNYFLLDANRQMRRLTYTNLNRSGVMSLFGDQASLLFDYWPRYAKQKDGDDEPPVVIGFKPEMAQQALMEACAAKGVLDVSEQVRGPGCWLADDGALIYHAGNAIYHGDRERHPGKIGDHVYPSAPIKPKPATEQSCPRAGEDLLDLLKTWSWRRPDLDPYLLLGWIGAAILGGALEWRPLIWVTGDKATGKSTLHKIIHHVLGQGGVISVTDASAAGLWQSVGHASLPIALDELEAEEDNRRNNNIVKLARLAASGGRMVRGGADHKNAEFTLRSCFMFSSILMPPMLGQDVSRMAILQLDKLEAKAPPSLKPDELGEIGAKLRRRLFDQWERLPETLLAYQTMLAEAGHGGRGADQFGTLLACYDLMMFDSTPHTDPLSDWCEILQKANLLESEDDIADHDRCIEHLLSAVIDGYRGGEKKQVGTWIARAIGQLPGGDVQESNGILGSYGLKLDLTNPTEKILLVANSHQGVANIFKETHWCGRAGSTGVWVQALRRVPGAMPGGTTRFDGVPARCTRLPLDSILPKEVRNV